MSQGKSKTMSMQNFWGVEAVYYGIVQEENAGKTDVNRDRFTMSVSTDKMQDIVILSWPGAL